LTDKYSKCRIKTLDPGALEEMGPLFPVNEQNDESALNFSHFMSYFNR